MFTSLIDIYSIKAVSCLLYHYLASSGTRHLCVCVCVCVDVYVCVCVCSLLCLTLCGPMDCRLPGSSVHGIFQARILDWVATPYSRGSSRPRD